MRVLNTSLVMVPWLVGLGVSVGSASSLSASASDSVAEGRFGSGQPREASARLATQEEIERMRKSNADITAGFARIDGLLKDIDAARTKIKQVIENHQELALCIALQQAQNEANKITALKTPLSPDQKQTFQGYRRTHADLSSDIRKAGIVCPSSQTPR